MGRRRSADGHAPLTVFSDSTPCFYSPGVRFSPPPLGYSHGFPTRYQPSTSVHYPMSLQSEPNHNQLLDDILTRWGSHKKKGPGKVKPLFGLPLLPVVCMCARATHACASIEANCALHWPSPMLQARAGAAVSRALCVRHSTWWTVGQHTPVCVRAVSCLHPPPYSLPASIPNASGLS